MKKKENTQQNGRALFDSETLAEKRIHTMLNDNITQYPLHSQDDEEEEENTKAEEEELECRICREEGDEERPLLHPCACSGSIKWCHESCVLDWLKASGRRNVCETCGKALTFNPLYQPNAPEVLSPAEFTWLIVKRLVKKLPTLIRFVCVSMTWLYIVPVFAGLCLDFLRTDRTGPEVSRYNSAVFALYPFSTWEQGVWVLIVGFCAMFLLVMVVDFVRQYEMGVFNLEVEQLRQQNRLGGAGVAAPVARQVVHADELPHARHIHAVDEAWLAAQNDDDEEDEGEEEDLDVDPLDVQEMGEHFEDFELEDDQDGLEDWIGLRGPMCRIFNHALFVCLFVALFLVTFHTVPELPGRALLRLLHQASSPFYPSTIVQATTVTRQVECPQCLYHFTDRCYVQDTALAREKLARVMVEASSVVVGTLSEMLTLVAFNVLLGYVYRRLIPSSHHAAWLPVLRITRSICRIQKIICMFAFKMLVFPIVLGLLIERAIRPALPLTDEDRLFFAAERPHLALLILWFAGITHTLLVSINVILVRDILHPQVLDGVIRTRDPHANQFLPMLLEPCMYQFKRTMVTSVIYTTIVLLFIALPVRLASAHLPLHSLRMHVFFASVEAPVGLVLFHIWQLNELERNKPHIVVLQERFFKYWCRVLDLAEYLLPMAVDQEQYNQARRDALQQAAMLHWLDATPRVPEALLKPRVAPAYSTVRVTCLLCIAWATWLTFSLVVLLVPYKVGMLVGYCFPVNAAQLTTDLRLFFVGWYITSAVLETVDWTQVWVHVVNRARAEQVLLLLFMVFNAMHSPLLFGVLPVLMVGSRESSFPSSTYEKLAAMNDFELVLCFLADLCKCQPVDRMWCAGLPVLAVFSLTPTAKYIWQAWLRGSYDQVIAKYLLAMCQFAVFLLSGVTTGLLLWHYVSKMTMSPLYLVRLCVLCVIGTRVAVWFLVRNWTQIQAGWRRVHQSLKDEKYLLGKRLINFES